MPEVVNPVSIFVPVLVVVALTLVAWLRMIAGRGAAAKSGVDESFYRAQIGGAEPEATVVAVRHYHNVLELPTVFYAAVLSAFVLGAVSGWALVWAWGYAVLRVVQSVVHLTYNRPAHRGIAFLLGAVCVFALWVVVALAVFARL